MEANTHEDSGSDIGEPSAAILAGRVQGTRKRRKKLPDVAGLTGRPVLSTNPLLRSERVEAVDVGKISAPTVSARRTGLYKRDIRDARRLGAARDAIVQLAPGIELYGFTKGQFSLLDLLQAIFEITGPADFVLSTWTAARHEIQSLQRMSAKGTIRSMRWLVDHTFARRDPGAAYLVRQTFGTEAMRVAQNHAKFALIRNDEWDVVLRTSMNLNMNPRFEDFTVAHDPELAAFLRNIIDEIWSRQRRSLANARPAEVRHFFLEEV
jgi:hypothetical protein